MTQLTLVPSFQVGDVVTFKNPDTEHQLGKKTCEVMALEGDVVQLIEQGSSLNKPQYWIPAQINELELGSESKTLKEVKSDEDVGQKTNNHSDIEETSTPPLQEEEEFSNNESNLLDEKSSVNSNEESDSPPSVDKISETNGYEQLPLNIDNNSEIKSSSDFNPDENEQISLNSKPDSDLSSSRDSMINKDDPVKPLTDNNSKHSIIQDLEISKISATDETQSRCKLDSETINEYAESMNSGVILPPVTIYDDGENHYLADGFHRLEAAKKCGLSTINAEVRQGSKSDAILYSVGANATHGLRRTNADKRKAVETVLKNEEWRGWSNNHIAKLCGATHPFVRKIREELYSNTESEERTYTDKHGNTVTMKTGNIGKNSNKTGKSKKEGVETTEPTFETGNIGKNSKKTIKSKKEVVETTEATLFDLESSTQPETPNENKEDKNNTVEHIRYVERLEKNFEFVKTEILRVASSSPQETQIIEAFNLIHGVLRGYLEELS